MHFDIKEIVDLIILTVYIYSGLWGCFLMVSLLTQIRLLLALLILSTYNKF